eukprot:scaffold413387_cov34-Prasinocladus_malaysianus.AAC.1
MYRYLMQTRYIVEEVAKIHITDIYIMCPTAGFGQPLRRQIIQSKVDIARVATAKYKKVDETRGGSC